MLKHRLLTSAVLLSFVGVLLFLDHRVPLGSVAGLWLLPLLLFLAGGTAYDFVRLLRSSGHRPDVALTIAVATLIPSAAAIPLFWSLTGADYPANCPIGRLGWIPIAATAAMAASLLREMLTYGKNDGTVIFRLLSSAFAIIYVGIPFAFFVLIRDLNDAAWGFAALITWVAVTKSTDAGAYFTGKLFGRHKIFPKLSPGKTWQGAIGGCLAAITVAYASATFLFPWLASDAAQPAPLWGAMIFGIVCAVFGMFGDLAESLVKRETNAKDSGHLLPGLGGVWDVTDSLIATSVPAFLCLAAGAFGN